MSSCWYRYGILVVWSDSGGRKPSFNARSQGNEARLVSRDRARATFVGDDTSAQCPRDGPSAQRPTPALCSFDTNPTQAQRHPVGIAPAALLVITPQRIPLRRC